MGKGSGVSRGDRRRNARLAELRVLVPRENAIIGIDLAEDNQAVVVTDHDSKVLARRSPRCKAWQLGAVLDWAVARARAAVELAGRAGTRLAGARASRCTATRCCGWSPACPIARSVQRRKRSASTYPDPGVIPTADAAVWCRSWWGGRWRTALKTNACLPVNSQLGADGEGGRGSLDPVDHHGMCRASGADRPQGEWPTGQFATGRP